MIEYNETQKAAIELACSRPLTLISGPPGTGKTKTLTAIVANMILQRNAEQVLILTQMNLTADLVAQELYKIKFL